MKPGYFLAFAAFALAAMPLPAAAQSAASIVDALTPKPLTRSWSRGVTIEGEQEKEAPPSVDLYVTFAFDSDRLDTDAFFVLDNLGRALNDEKLREFRFLLAGHTDAKGTDEYNLDLSHRRAATVKRYLMEKFAIQGDRLETAGHGESRLLDPSRPEDGINRRVQVVNLSQPAEEEAR